MILSFQSRNAQLIATTLLLSMYLNENDREETRKKNWGFDPKGNYTPKLKVWEEEADYESAKEGTWLAGHASARRLEDGSLEVETPTSSSVWIFKGNKVTYNGPFRGICESPFVPNFPSGDIMSGKVESSMGKMSMKDYFAKRAIQAHEAYLKEEAKGELFSWSALLNPPTVLRHVKVGIHQVPAVQGFEHIWPAGPQKVVLRHGVDISAVPLRWDDIHQPA